MTVQANDRRLYLWFHIDTNRINARGGEPNMNRLQRWADSEVITIQMAGAARSEALAGGRPERVRAANRLIFTVPTMLNQDEVVKREAIERVLSPGGAKTQGERNDVAIVFDAAKYGAILVTNDGGSKRQPGGILGNRDRLAALGVTVMTDAEAVSLVEHWVGERDRLTRAACERTGAPIPDWVGGD